MQKKIVNCTWFLVVLKLHCICMAVKVQLFSSMAWTSICYIHGWFVMLISIKKWQNQKSKKKLFSSLCVLDEFIVKGGEFFTLHIWGIFYGFLRFLLWFLTGGDFALEERGRVFYGSFVMIFSLCFWLKNTFGSVCQCSMFLWCCQCFHQGGDCEIMCDETLVYIEIGIAKWLA